MQIVIHSGGLHVKVHADHDQVTPFREYDKWILMDQEPQYEIVKSDVAPRNHCLNQMSLGKKKKIVMMPHLYHNL